MRALAVARPAMRATITGMLLAASAPARHATIGEAMMSVAILGDDRVRYNKSIQVFHSTVADYLRWGRGQPASSGRLLGESSEVRRGGVAPWQCAVIRQAAPLLHTCCCTVRCPELHPLRELTPTCSLTPPPSPIPSLPSAAA